MKPINKQLFTFFIAAAFILIVGGVWFIENKAFIESGDSSEQIIFVDRGLSKDQFFELQLRIEILEQKEGAENILELADAKYRIGDLAGAEELYISILESIPENATVLDILGQIKKERGLLSEAETLWREVILLDPQEEIYLKLIDLLLSEQNTRIDDAKTLVQEGIATLGETVELLLREGDYLFIQEKYKDAENAYRKAFQLAPIREDIQEKILLTEQF